MKNLRSVDCCARCKHCERWIRYQQHEKFACLKGIKGVFSEAPEVQPFHICDLFERVDEQKS